MAISSSRLTRFGRLATAVALSVSLISVTHIAVADPVDPGHEAIASADAVVDATASDVAAYASRFADVDARLAELTNRLSGLKNDVTKALVDFSQAEADAAAAAAQVTEASAKLAETDKRLAEAREALKSVSRELYVRGQAPEVSAVAGSRTTKDALDAAAFARSQGQRRAATMAELEQLKLAQINEQSELKALAKDAEDKKAAASEAHNAAEAQLAEVNAQLADAEAQRQQLESERAQAEARLQAAKLNAGALRDQQREYREYVAARAEHAVVRDQAQQAVDKEAESRAVLDEVKKQAEVLSAQAQEAEAKGEANAPELKAQAAQAVSAVQVAENTHNAAQFDAKQAADALKTAAAVVGMAAGALKVINDLAGNGGSSDRSVSNVAGAAATATQVVTTTGGTVPDAFDPDLIKAADTLLTNAAQGAAGDLAAVVGGEVSAEPPAPSGTQAEIVQRAQRANPGENYSMLQLYRGFDTITPADLGLVTADSITNFNGSRQEKIEAMIARAQSQIGVPYAWGGGNAAGPTRGIRDGGVADSYGDYNKVGFDCSGLVLYAAAGIGIALPHYTGYQYQKGTKVAISDIQRGDLLFWGPNAEYHVAIYLGNGQMIEAPQSGSHVKISPVRYSGMSPYAVRLI